MSAAENLLGSFRWMQPGATPTLPQPHAAVLHGLVVQCTNRLVSENSALFGCFCGIGLVSAYGAGVW